MPRIWRRCARWRRRGWPSAAKPHREAAFASHRNLTARYCEHFEHTMTTIDDLRDLVDAPSETLSVEYKCSLDFSDKVSKAKFARHVAALANYGGGHIIFGFKDNMSVNHVTEFSDVNHDSVASVVKHYLSPAFQCEVRVVQSSAGTRHTVVSVPTHTTVPICTHKDGPQDAKGNPQGIRCGIFYIRKPGPESAPIDKPTEWAPVIRRCAIAERASILGAIEVALKGKPADDLVESRLRKWHSALATEFRVKMENIGNICNLTENYTQFSFAIHHNGSDVSFDELAENVAKGNAEAEMLIKSHWALFAISQRDEYLPRFRNSSEIENGEYDFLEASLIEGSYPYPTIWRTSTEGFTSLIKVWWEDGNGLGAQPGIAVSPIWLAQDIVSVVVFARALARNFEAATAVTFLFEWSGLKDRCPYDPRGRWHSTGHQSRESRKISIETFPVTELEAGWEGPSARLAGPLARAIGIDRTLNKDWFASWKHSWSQRS